MVKNFCLFRYFNKAIIEIPTSPTSTSQKVRLLFLCNQIILLSKSGGGVRILDIEPKVTLHLKGEGQKWSNFFVTVSLGGL